jgi:hypothetical protein
MILPILIWVSVTPVSYFFCAAAGIEAAAMISPERPSVLISVVKKCVKFFAQRFMKSLLRTRRDGFLSDSFLFWLFLIGADGSSRTNLPEAALDRIIRRLSQAICRAGGRGATQQVTRNTAAILHRRGRSVIVG